ncbi:MAG: tetratricopeptide repeat protein [bacterium]
MIALLLALLAVEPISIAEVHRLVEAGQAGDALERITATAQANPTDIPLQKALALVLRSVGSTDSAVAIYDRLLEVDPADDDARAGREIALSMRPAPAEPIIRVAEVHELVNAGRAGEARERIEAAARANPSDRDLRKALALVLRSVGELDSAIAVYDRLLVEDKADDDTRLGKAITLSWQDRLDAAQATYAEVGPQSQQYFEALVGKAQVAAWSGRHSDALRWLEEAEALDPSSRIVQQRRAQVLSWSGDHAAAIRLYERLVEQSPDNADLWFGLGQNYEWTERPAAARRCYQRALELAPGRKEFVEAATRAAAASSPRVRVEAASASDFDGDVQGTYRDYRFRYEHRSWDRLVPSAAVSLSSNRRGALGRDYLLVRGAVLWRPLSWLRVTGQAQGDALQFGLKAATLGWEADRAWLSWSGEAGRVLFEPAQDLGALSSWTALAARPLPRLRLDARAARLRVTRDGNVKTALSAGAGFDVVAKPRLTVSYNFSYDDFAVKSPLYYSPQDLVTNTLGAGIRLRRDRWGVSADAAGGLNADDEWVARANAAFDWEFVRRTTVALDAGFARTAGRGQYVYGSVGLSVSRAF